MSGIRRTPLPSFMEMSKKIRDFILFFYMHMHKAVDFKKWETDEFKEKKLHMLRRQKEARIDKSEKVKHQNETTTAQNYFNQQT